MHPATAERGRSAATLRVAAFLAFLSLVAVPAGPSHARPLDEVVASKTLRVIAYLDNAPFSDEVDGKPVGVEVDLARAIARELGVEAEVVLRMQGEKADDDLRANVWKGPLTGGGVGDVMLHVPIDREFALRNPEAVLGNPYFQQQIVLVVHPELIGVKADFDTFKSKKIGVQIGTVSDYFLMRYQEGALIENIAHHLKPAVGAKEFAAKEVTALMGVRANLEFALDKAGVTKPSIVQLPPMEGIVRRNWVVGTAVNEKSRDLGYAIQAALEKIRASGELDRICAAHGITYTPPPPP